MFRKISIPGIKTKEMSKITWDEKVQLLEDITRYSLLKRASCISDSHFIELLIKSFFKNNVTESILLKNTGFFISFLSSTLNVAFMEKLREEGNRHPKGLEDYIMTTPLSFGGRDAILYVNLLDYPIKDNSGIKDMIDISAAAIVEKREAYEDSLKLSIGDRVQLLTPLLVAELFTSNGNRLDLNRSIDLKMFDNLIVADPEIYEKGWENCVDVFLREEGILRVRKKYITLKS
jgi:hypothetical protein